MRVALALCIQTQTMVSTSLGDAIYVEIAEPPPFFDDRRMLRLSNWADPIYKILKRG